MKLNGWQRLWILGWGVWTLPIILVAYSTWPSAAGVADADLWSRLSPTDQAKLIPPSGADVSALMQTKPPTLDDWNAATPVRPERSSTDLAKKYGLQRAVRTPDGTIHLFPADATDAQILEALVPRYRDAEVRDALTRSFTNDLEGVRREQQGLKVISSSPLPATFDGHTIEFANGVSQSDADSVSKNAAAVLKRMVAVSRARQIGLVAALWAIPAMLIYAFGWAVAWVRRGFVG